MLTAMYEEMDGRYGRWLEVQKIDSENLCCALEIFDDYKKRGIILNESFDDALWKLSNQTKNVGLTLITFDGDYHKNLTGWIGCDYRCYLDCVKAYIVFNLGEFSLLSLQGVSNTLIRFAGKTSDEAVNATKHMNHILELLQIIPGGNEVRDYVIEKLEERLEQRFWKQRKGKQRRLADFNSYLKFNEIMSRFWGTANYKQKLFYFPLYFWWNLTAILPLRPMEFLLTPRDCLETDNNGNNILTVRRTKLKGGVNKIAYSIAGDYECKKYTIHEKLANELRSYLNATDGMGRTEIGTLFVRESHYNYFGVSTNPLSKYYSYSYLNTSLRYFYQEVINMESTGIDRIRLGDTRHLAMANLIISGGSPVICRELAGHSDIDISSHYYSNISNLVECVTIERYRKSKGESAEIIGIPKYAIALPKTHYRVLDGWCDAPLIKDGDISECLKVSDKQGQIGRCTHCIHYWPDEKGIRLEFLDKGIGKQEVDADCRYLMRMIELVRRGIGYDEDIGSALLRLQRSSDHYSKCLWEKYMKADDKAWQGQKK